MQENLARRAGEVDARRGDRRARKSRGSPPGCSRARSSRPSWRCAQRFETIRRAELERLEPKLAGAAARGARARRRDHPADRREAAADADRAAEGGRATKPTVVAYADALNRLFALVAQDRRQDGTRADRFATRSSSGRAVRHAAHRHARQPARAVAGEHRRRASLEAQRADAPRSSSSRRPAIACRSAPLSEVGGKRLFVKEIEDALLGGEIDLAVHSSKDMSAVLPDGLDDRRGAAARGSARRAGAAGDHRHRETSTPRWRASAPRRRSAPAASAASRSSRRCFPARASRRSAAMSTRGCASSTPVSTTRSCSPRPACGAWGSARASPRRSRIDVCVPAPGQGIVAIEIRERRRARRVTLSPPINDAAAGASLAAERAVVAALGGGCQLPLGALAIHDADGLDDACRRRHRPTDARASRGTVTRHIGTNPAALGARLADAVDPRRAPPRSSSAREGPVERATEMSADESEPCVYHRRRRARRPGPDHRPRPALPRGGRRRGLRPPGARAAAAQCAADAEQHRRRRGGAAAARPGCDLLSARREGARGQDGRAPQVGRSRSCSTAAARKRCSSTSRACRSRSCRASRRRSAARPTPASRSRIPAAATSSRWSAATKTSRTRPPTVDWARLASLDGTLVCYAGAQQIGAIARRARWRTAGRRRNRGAHLRRHAAVAARPWTATLGTIAEHAPTARAPAMLVVGAVAGSARPPALVRRPPALRPADRGDALARAGRRARRHARGARRRRDRGADDPDRAAGRSRRARSRRAREAGAFDWIVFTSANAVDYFMRRAAGASATSAT